jgi:hypothetical protein
MTWRYEMIDHHLSEKAADLLTLLLGSSLVTDIHTIARKFDAIKESKYAEGGREWGVLVVLIRSNTFI